MANLKRQGRRKKVGVVAVAMAAVALLGASCDSGDETEAAEPSTSSQPTTTAAPQAVIRLSPVNAAFDMGGYVDHEGNDLSVDDLPLPEGTVTAHWYRSGDLYAVVYAGTTAEELAACVSPGLIVPDAERVQFLSALPLVEGACEEFTSGPPSKGRGLKACDGLIIYETDIRVADSEGETQLTAWFGWVTDIGKGGVRSTVDTDIPETPELDFDADTYQIPAEFLPDGRTTVSC